MILLQQIAVLEMIVFCFSIQREDINEYDNDKCHMFKF